MKARKEKPFDLVMGEDGLNYCRHHRILAMWHHKAMRDYCPICWMEGHKPKCDMNTNHSIPDRRMMDRRMMK